MPGYEFAHPLGDTVKQARHKANLTQKEVAELIDIDVRTVLNIENYKGNPKMKVIHPLIRVLKIDPRDIFFPEQEQECLAIRQLKLVLAECTENEAQVLLPVCESILSALRCGKSDKF